MYAKFHVPNKSDFSVFLVGGLGGGWVVYKAILAFVLRELLFPISVNQNNVQFLFDQ